MSNLRLIAFMAALTLPSISFAAAAAAADATSEDLRMFFLNNRKDTVGGTILHNAAYKNESATIQKIFTVASALAIPPFELIKMQDWGGNTALHSAIYNKSHAAIQSILSYIESSTDLLKLLSIQTSMKEGGVEIKETVLHIAAKSDRFVPCLELIMVVLNKAINSDPFGCLDLLGIKNKNGRTALEKAKHNGEFAKKIADMLERAEFDAQASAALLATATLYEE